MLVEIVGKVWHCSTALRWFWNVVLSFEISLKLIKSERTNQRNVSELVVACGVGQMMIQVVVVVFSHATLTIVCNFNRVGSWLYAFYILN